MGFQAPRLGNSNSRFCLLIFLPPANEVVGTYVFSRVCPSVRHSVNLGGGSNMTITHDALHLTIHGPLALPHGTSLYRNPPAWPPPLDLGPHCTGPSLPPWPLLVISVHLRTFPQLVLISGCYWSTCSFQAGGTHPYWNAYLFDIYWACHKNYLIASIKITGDRLYFLQSAFFNWIWLASLYFAIF